MDARWPRAGSETEERSANEGELQTKERGLVVA